MPLMPILDQMPSFILENIASRLELKSRMRLRKTSKQLRAVVDNSHHDIATMLLLLEDNNAIFNISTRTDPDFEIYYKERPFGCLIESSEKNQETGTRIEKKTHTVKGMDSYKTALSDFKTFVKNPKCSIKQFELTINGNIEDFVDDDLDDDFDDDFDDEDEDEDEDEADCLDANLELTQTLRSLNKQLFVEKLYITCLHNEIVISELLPFFKTGTLTTIGLCMYPFEYNWMALEQWRQVKELDVSSGIPIDQLLHCNKFELSTINEFSLEGVTTMIETAIRRVEQFESFTVGSHLFADIDGIWSYIEREFPIVGNSEGHRYRRIQEANCYLRLFFDNKLLTIDKTLVTE